VKGERPERETEKGGGGGEGGRVEERRRGREGES